jgi:molybdopterin converting factor small subunit
VQVEIILFGQLTDIAGRDKIVISNVSDTDELVRAIEQQYPAMAGAKYIIAADKRVVGTNTRINEKTELALLPPFSGG